MKGPVTTAEHELVTFRVGEALFGVEVTAIREVFLPQAVTPAPLAPPEVTGVLNLRGRIVTMICARRRLGLPPRAAESRPAMAIGVDHRGDSYGLLVDSVDEVLRVGADAFEATPPNLDARWSGVSRGVYRLDGRLLVAVELERILDLRLQAAA